MFRELEVFDCFSGVYVSVREVMGWGGLALGLGGYIFYYGMFKMNWVELVILADVIGGC